MNVLRPGKVLTTARADRGVGPYSRLGGNVGAGSHPSRCPFRRLFA